MSDANVYHIVYVCLCVCAREDSCLCHVSGVLVSEFQDDLTAISSCSEEDDLSKLCQYLTAGRGKLILQLLSVTGVAVSAFVLTVTVIVLLQVD